MTDTDPTAAPAPVASPQTIGDLITNVQAAASAVASDTAAVAAASAQLTTDQAAAQTSGAALGTALTISGPVFNLNQDNTASFFSSDGAGGYHVTTAQPATTPIPTSGPAPAPAPAPAPSPDPGPASLSVSEIDDAS